MLKPALARGDVHVIGATTVDEYRRTIERDGALARRFQPILVPEPTVDDTVAILRGLRDGYEAHHQVRFTDEVSSRPPSSRTATSPTVSCQTRRSTSSTWPVRGPGCAWARQRAGRREIEQELDALQRDKEQAVTDEQYERATSLRDRITEVRGRLEGAPGEGDPRVPVVDVPEIAEVVARATGIPVSQLTEEERDRLIRLEAQLQNRVIGQDEAVTAVAEAVRRSRAGLADPEPSRGQFPFPRADRRRQDGAGPSAGGDTLR